MCFLLRPKTSSYTTTTLNFTSAGASGPNGPTTSQIDSSYGFNMPVSIPGAQGVQLWTVADTSNYTFTVAGASGGSLPSGGGAAGGAGNIVSGVVNLTAGTLVYIVVGQAGASNPYQASGGGGTFVFKDSITIGNLLFAAGGGGGAGMVNTGYPVAGGDGSTTTNGSAGADATYYGSTNTSSGGAGGTSGSPGGTGVTVQGSLGNSTNCNGGGGGVGQSGGGGGGGVGSIVTTATFLGGAAGSGPQATAGGFGGGGGSPGGDQFGFGGGGGGGGGYSGGGGGGGGGYGGRGGGGSSFVAATVTSPNISSGKNTIGSGYVTVVFTPTSSSISTSMKLSDSYVNFFQVGKDIDPAVTTTVPSPDNLLSIDTINARLWNDPAKSAYWGFRKVLQNGGGGAVSYLTFANDAAATAALTQDAGVLTVISYQGQDYTIPTVVIVKKSVSFITPVITTGREHACIIQPDSKLWCTGGNSQYQIGAPSYVIGYNPTQYSFINWSLVNNDNFIDVSCGHYHTCAVKSDGTVYWWGGGDYNKSSPTLVSGIAKIIKVACGASHTVVLKSYGTVYCWGDNTYGQLGNGTTASQSNPTLVPNLSNITSIACGAYHTCALKNDGTVYCWGSNSNGQIGDGTTTNTTSPKLVAGLTGIKKISTGWNFVWAFRSDDNTVWGWGQATSAPGSASSDYTSPTSFSTLVGFSSISVSANHSCGIDSTGTVKCWGDNTYGQLGDGTTTSQTNPTVVIQNVNSSAVGCTDYGTFSTASGNMYEWGSRAGPYPASIGFYYPNCTNLPAQYIVDNIGRVTTPVSGKYFTYSGVGPSTPSATCPVNDCELLKPNYYRTGAGNCNQKACTSVPSQTPAYTYAYGAYCPVGCNIVCPANSYWRNNVCWASGHGVPNTCA